MSKELPSLGEAFLDHIARVAIAVQIADGDLREPRREARRVGEAHRGTRGSVETVHLSFIEILRSHEDLRRMLLEVLNSASPNPRDHPTMCKAWGRARKLLGLKHDPYYGPEDS